MISLCTWNTKKSAKNYIWHRIYSWITINMIFHKQSTFITLICILYITFKKKDSCKNQCSLCYTMENQVSFIYFRLFLQWKKKLMKCLAYHLIAVNITWFQCTVEKYHPKILKWFERKNQINEHDISTARKWTSYLSRMQN